MRNKDTINHQKMPAPNKQFAASGGVARLTTCGDFELSALVRALVPPPPVGKLPPPLGASEVRQRRK